MKVVAIVNKKGGVGKSTLTGHLAVEAHRQGLSSVVADCDPQGNLADWYNDRVHVDDVGFLNSSVEELGTKLAALRKAVDSPDVVFIDTPPKINAAIKAAIALADHVLIPLRPSPHDLRAVRHTLKLVQEAGKPFSFALNGAQTPSLTLDALAALEGASETEPAVLGQRVAFVRSMIDGRVAVEVDKRGKAAQEVTALWQSVSNQLGN
jgi:chromosome partitioning protein